MEPLTILVIILVFLLILFLLFWGGILYIRYRFFRFGKKFVTKIIDHIIHNVRGLPAAQKILEYDKVLDKVLGQVGYQGSLGDKMKQYGKKFKDEHAIWEAHKQRNKVAHEIGYMIDEKQSQKLARAYEREIEGLMKKPIKK